MNEIKEILSPIFTSEWVRCKKCGHSAESHYWNGGGRVEYSGYDSCLADGCKCVYDEKETEILPVVAEEALKGYIEELESYINSHYIAKEKVAQFKCRQISGFYKDMLGQWFKRYPTCGVMVTDETLLDALNVRQEGIDEINKAIDSLISSESN